MTENRPVVRYEALNGKRNPSRIPGTNRMKIEQKISNTGFSIFMRQLHVLALVQHSTSTENMNNRTMADLLSFVPWDGDVSEKKIATCIDKLKEMGFPLLTSQGGARVMLERELSGNEMLEVLPYYLNLVSDTMGIRDCFKSYVENHGTRSLWIIGRIYFASLQKKKIELTYRPARSTEPELYRLNPYRWIYRDNAVYLVAKTVKHDISLFRLNRIRDVAITGEGFSDEIPSADELLKYSMGAYISSTLHHVKITFPADMRERVQEDFGHLELSLDDTSNPGFIDASFTVCDLVTVCQTIFGYNGRVKITAPDEAVSEMKRMLQQNIAAY